MRAKEQALQKGLFYQKFGNDPAGVISKGFAKYKNHAKSTEEVREFAEMQKKILKRLEIASGFEYAEYNTLRYIGDGAK